MKEKYQDNKTCPWRTEIIEKEKRNLKILINAFKMIFEYIMSPKLHIVTKREQLGKKISKVKTIIAKMKKSR